jgi:cysteinyl-tRNA synthetase
LNISKCENIYESVEILCNDINTSHYLTRLLTAQPVEHLGMLCSLIGFKPSVLYLHLQCEITPSIFELANKREALKEFKDWNAADAIRDEIIAQGYEIMDQKGGGGQE